LLVAVVFITVGTATMVAFLTSPPVAPPAEISTGAQIP